MNESDFIAALRKLPLHDGARNLEDDAAILEVGSETLVLTHDTIVSGVHFLPFQDMADVAWKLVTTNLSDLAAKGAEPVGILLSHMLSTNDDRFVQGLTEVLETYGCPLLGGDTVSSDGPPTYGVTAVGRATHSPVPSRGGAQAGDSVYITGPVGAAMLGFEALRDDTSAGGSAYTRPIPLLAEGQALAPVVTAIMDVSDGVLLDASRIAKASKVTLDIDPASVPIATPEARRDEALRWGDDYQLLFTLPDTATLPVSATRIGRVLEPTDSPILLEGTAPDRDSPLGYSH
ncbi:thiamine-phosphate kinase [Pontixanthobacter aestiaquae]|uniref:Thiamine-monophosphate kinase n=1 Tax=Pontixanthobacter aestiaquae TaxID=1509367 RepID=A0A844Z5S4_9SPHN|nr:thiamine-phosphate kinase [Pontixanthobacter aestiaquae]MDN3645868.1 thiamine-phosphate kinase [Pontixanthobacter aestiaquae]MXO83138.1 thiamine-phosphate kinase [Pontixanthobacter aestiaquae]